MWQSIFSLKSRVTEIRMHQKHACLLQTPSFLLQTLKPLYLITSFLNKLRCSVVNTKEHTQHNEIRHLGLTICSNLSSFWFLKKIEHTGCLKWIGWSSSRLNSTSGSQTTISACFPTAIAPCNLKTTQPCCSTNT